MKSIQKLTLVLLAVFGIMVVPACSSDNDNLEGYIPEKINSFINQYFPGYSVESYSMKSSTYHVKLKNGPGMTFDDKETWVSINGYGLTLPGVLMFDQLPPELYMYLQETENTDNVFAVDRDNIKYTVVLLQETVNYDIASGRVTVSTAPSN